MEEKHKERSVTYDQFIPGLPDDVGIYCLLRVPRMYNVSMRLVCRSWNKLLHAPDFFALRQRLNLSDAWLILILMDLVQKNGSYAFCIYDLATRSLLGRAVLPDPWLSDGLSTFKTAAINTCLLVIESKTTWCRTTLENRTRMYDTVSNRWTRAANPNVPRFQFAMAGIGNAAFVCGGYNNEGDFETSVEKYDLEANRWEMCARMPINFDRVDGEVVYKGKIYVRGFIGDSGDCVMLVYDPVGDKWERGDSGMNAMDHGELIATSNGIYCFTASDSFYRFSGSEGQWVLERQGETPKRCSLLSNTSVFNLHSQRAFGIRKEVFVLGRDFGGSSCAMGDGISFHGLILGNSWFRAGSILLG